MCVINASGSYESGALGAGGQFWGWVTVPCHSVAAWCRLTFELTEALQQQHFAYVVEPTFNMLIFIHFISLPHNQQT